MKIRELIAMLVQYEGEMEVEFANYYARAEGWEEGCENASCEIDCIREIDGRLVLEKEF